MAACKINIRVLRSQQHFRKRAPSFAELNDAISLAQFAPRKNRETACPRRVIPFGSRLRLRSFSFLLLLSPPLALFRSSSSSSFSQPSLPSASRIISPCSREMTPAAHLLLFDRENDRSFWRLEHSRRDPIYAIAIIKSIHESRWPAR